MLVLDSAGVDRHLQHAKVEGALERQTRWCQEVFLRSVQATVEGPSNLERQWGKPMSPRALLRLTKQLAPNTWAEINPFRPTIWNLYMIKNGKKSHVAAFHNEVMPEFSYMGTMEVEHPTLAYAQEVTGHPVVPKKEVKSLWAKLGEAQKTYSDGEFWQHVEELRPNTTPKQKVLWREEFRGWRTVLLKLVVHKLTTPDLVERLVGAAERESWASHLGKRPTTSKF